MNFFRRAIRYCWRQKIRSIILLLVFTLLASAALIALTALLTRFQGIAKKGGCSAFKAFYSCLLILLARIV